MNRMKIKIFTDSGLDGLSSAMMIIACMEGAVINTVFTDNANINNELQTFIYDEKPDDYQYIFITDLSVDYTLWRIISEKPYAYRFILINHDFNSRILEYIEPSNTDILSIPEFVDGRLPSSAELTLMKLRDRCRDDYNLNIKPSERFFKEFAEVVAIHDRQQPPVNKDDELRANTLYALTVIMPAMDFIYDRMKNIRLGLPFVLSQHQRAILDYKMSENAEYVEDHLKNIIYRRNAEKINFGIVFAEKCESSIANAICETHTEIGVAVVINPIKRKVTLRTIKDTVSVAVFAKNRGGGGQRKSAGFVYSNDTQNVFIDSVLQFIK